MKKRYPQKRKKLNFYVKRDLQFWILFRFIAVVFISIVIALFILYAFSHKELGATFYKAHLTLRYVSDLLLPVIFVSGGICLLAGFLFAIFFPQRVAGPVYRVEKGLEAVGQGKFSHVFKLRKTDHFQSLADAANLAMQRVNEEFNFFSEGLKEIERLLEEGELHRINEKIKLLEKRLEEIRT